MADIELKVLVKGEATEEEVTESIIKALKAKKKKVSKEQFNDEAMISVAESLQDLFVKQQEAMIRDIERALDEFAEELESE